MLKLSTLIQDVVLKLCSKYGQDLNKGFVSDIEKDTIDNINFRKVLYTGQHSQLVLMSLKPKEDIGEEIHDVDQFFRIESGKGLVVINDKETLIKNGSAIVVPAGAQHNVINRSDKDDLKLYSIYSPPHHKNGTIHKTKDDAEKDTEHFDGVTSE
jgi:mannose-6-phosphate isomerase-like protein (cupin superfamily)